MAEKGITGKEREKIQVLRSKGRLFLERDKVLKVGETDELVIFVRFVMASSLTGANLLR